MFYFLISALILFFSVFVEAQNTTISDPSREIEEEQSQTVDNKPLKKILINGLNEDFISNTVTPVRLSKERVELYKYTDVNRALKQTTGVYVREEDGLGLRPNIGLRGTNPDRSKKIVFMEDGVLIGPAPYSAPAAYYTPSMSRTETLDVYKGFSAVPYGPNSIGGSLNYITKSIPNAFFNEANVSTGAFNTQNINGLSGGSSGRWGYVVNISHLRSDGFKELDGGGDVGFYQNDLMLKGKFKANNSQSLEMKLGYGNEKSNETYLGLATRDLTQNPFRRYASTALDNMVWTHTGVQLSHDWELSENSKLKTQIYRNDFERNWKRMDRFAGGGVTVPSLYNTLMFPEENEQFYNILTGAEDSSSSLTGAGDLIQAENQRTSYSQGLQVRWNTIQETSFGSNDLEMGVRYHQDQIRRDHLGVRYAMLNGRLVSTGASTQDAMNSYRARAITGYFIENLSLSNWVFTAIARIEQVQFDGINDLNVQTRNFSRDDDVFAPGAAVLYNFSKSTSLKASVNRGVSVAGLSESGSEAQERSINYEVGLKYNNASGNFLAELIAFYNDYSNITGTCTASTGCSNAQIDSQFNGGRAAIQGLEARAASVFKIGAVDVPVQLNSTFLNAEFKNEFESRSASEWGQGLVRVGDPLPYVPQVQYTLTVGSIHKNFRHDLAFIYQGESLDQSVLENRQKIDGYGIIDWTGKYTAGRRTELFARVDNLLGKDYTVSYRPFGARPGKPQSFMVGLTHRF